MKLWTRVRAGMRSPWFAIGAAAISYVLGVVWRWFYVFELHRPKDFVYSDMGMYHELAKRLSRDGYKLQPYDVTHPPGLSELMAHFYKTDPSLQNVARLQFVVTCVIPLAVGALAWLAFSRKAGLWSVVMTSFYFPFIDYGGYFLAEIYITVLATLTMVIYLAAVRVASPTVAGRLLALPRARLAGAIALAVLAGFVFSLAMLMKMVAAPALLCFFGIFVVFTRTAATWKTKAILLALVLVAAAPLTRWQSDRCTQANQGKFCPGSSKAPSDFLMGHIGRVQSVTWREPDPKHPGKYRGQVNFGSPAAFQHGYTAKAEFNFKISDGESNNREAWKWIRQHPGQAVVLSFEHVWDSFGGSLPWPSVATRVWPASQAYHYLFLFFLLFPSFLLLLDVARKRGIVGLLRSMELAIFAPIIGVIVSVMAATGEARYRIPWDMCFIVLAVQFYLGLELSLFGAKKTESETKTDSDSKTGSTSGELASEGERASGPPMALEPQD